MKTESDLFDAIAEQALQSLGWDYPHHIVHLLNSDDDAQPPHRLHPAFHGSFDWHSAVHSHWCVARLARLHPEARFAPAVRSWLDHSLTPENLRAEYDYLRAPGREGFERPYGLAWILELASEIALWKNPWHAALAPLEELAAERLVWGWEKLRVPVRGGEHAQTAFAMGLAWDWARRHGHQPYIARLANLARRFYGGDTNAPMGYDLSAADFLSPILAEADVMRRVLEPVAFAAWLDALLPDLESETAAAWLTPVTAVDRADGKLSHWDGLNLSRAWMLEAIAEALPSGARRDRLARAASAHRDAGLAACLSEHFAGAHWLGSFAVYLLTRES